MMRLACPNCAAQYEVEDDVIPPGGRDVQCSNCGHTWFQKPNEAPAADPAPTPQDDIAPASEPASDEVPQSDDLAPDTAPHDRAEPRRQVMDEDVSSVLREEAERERNERMAERESGLEMQTEMGLDGRSEEVSPSLSESAGIVEDDDTPVASGMVAATAKRKDMLPDIEEINSSLTPQVDGEIDQTPDAQEGPAGKNGFRRGFLLIVVIFVIMAAVYLLAPTIADQFPQTADMLAAYVQWVDGLSMSLNKMMADVADRMSNLLGAMNSDG